MDNQTTIGRLFGEDMITFGYQVIKELILGEWAKMDVLVRLICF